MSAGQSVAFERVRRVTGYLGTLDRFNDAKKAEEKDRVKHTMTGDDGYVLLAAAVIDRAVQDYEDAKDALKRIEETGREFVSVHGERMYRFTALANLADVDDFFRSKRAAALMSFDPMKLYDKIRENYERYGKCQPHREGNEVIPA
mgnify:CR=1 FL=1